MNINIKDYNVIMELSFNYDRNDLYYKIYFEIYNDDIYTKENLLIGSRTLGEWTDENISDINERVKNSQFVEETGLNPSEYINDTMSRYSNIRSDTNTAIYIIRKRASEIAK